MPLDPGRWPEMLPDEKIWAGRLQAAALEWAEEASRLGSMVRTPALGGPCARALWGCADQVAAEMAALAADVADASRVASALPPGRLR